MKFHFHKWGSMSACVRVETIEDANTSRIEEKLWVMKCSRCPKRKYKPRPGIRWIVQDKFEEI